MRGPNAILHAAGTATPCMRPLVTPCNPMQPHAAGSCAASKVSVNGKGERVVTVPRALKQKQLLKVLAAHRRVREGGRTLSAQASEGRGGRTPSAQASKGREECVQLPSHSMKVLVAHRRVKGREMHIPTSAQHEGPFTQAHVHVTYLLPQSALLPPSAPLPLLPAPL